MRRGGRLLVMVGLLLGAITAFGTFMVLGSVSEQPKIPTKSIVVALQNIPERTVVNTDVIGLKEWPEYALPSAYYERTEDVVGKLAISRIFPGQVVVPQQIVDKGKAGQAGSGSNASFVIAEGKFAMSFSAGDNVAGSLQPGDYIDLMLTLAPGSLPPAATRAATTGTEGLPVTQIMLQDVLILQVGAWGTEKAAGGVLTVQLDKQDALALKSAREQGGIDIILRRAGDHKITDTEPVTLQYLNKRFKFNLLPGGSGNLR
jgi:Flp pilus assembly protein CpaB